MVRSIVVSTRRNGESGPRDELTRQKSEDRAWTMDESDALGQALGGPGISLVGLFLPDRVEDYYKKGSNGACE